jgi:ferredoxin-NADP reductase
MRATVTEKREVARGTLLFVFDAGEPFDFQAGQYFWVELIDPPYTDDRGSRRHISVVLSPTEGGHVGLATRIRDTAFKRSLVELEVGDTVDVEPPKGDFRLPEDTSRQYVFVAGGIGITVFRSMLRYIADEQLPYRVKLVYSNRDRESTAFLDELQALEQRIDGFQLIATMTGDPTWEGETARVDAGFFAKHLDDVTAATYLLAGPPPMVEGVVEELKRAGVTEDKILPDRFSGY